jgi:hypothetical protein
MRGKFRGNSAPGYGMAWQGLDGVGCRKGPIVLRLNGDSPPVRI